jgi:Raf kinase inhibitor-like YbhB/YbcL family protein
MKSNQLISAACGLAVALCGCPRPCGKCDTAGPSDDTAPEPFALYAAAFEDGGPIDVRFTCDGDDVSPRLYWLGPPEGVASWALIMIDPDASDCPHWAIYDLPADQAWLSEGVSPGGDLPEGAKELNNFRGARGYAGPCPPAEHRYRFTLYALETERLDLPTSGSFDQLEEAAAGALIDRAILTGVYGG